MSILNFVQRLIRIVFGFFVTSTGIVLMIQAGIGLFPWGTLNAGLSMISTLTFGQCSQIIGLVVIIINIMLKSFPGIGTLLDMFLIGFFIDTIQSSGYIPAFHTQPLQLFVCLLGLAVFSFGLYIYMSADLGAGPRDSLMISIVRTTGKSITIVKPMIEITVTIAGVLLGGPLGLGTIILAVFGGKSLDLVFKLMHYDPATRQQYDFIQMYRTLTVKNK